MLWTCLNEAQSPSRPTTHPDRSQTVLFITLNFVRASSRDSPRRRTLTMANFSTASHSMCIQRPTYAFLYRENYVFCDRQYRMCNDSSAIFHCVDCEVDRCVFNSIQQSSTSHARTVVRECCKGDDESQWEGEIWPPPAKNPLTDGHQNLCR